MTESQNYPQTVGKLLEAKDSKIIQKLAEMGEISGYQYKVLESAAEIAVALQTAEYGYIYEVPNDTLKELGIRANDRLGKGVGFLTTEELSAIYG